MEKTIAVIRGDGVGPEIIDASLTVLSTVGMVFGHTFHTEELLLGGAALDATGVSLPADVADACKKADAVLMGPIGGAKWENLAHLAPEKAVFSLRNTLGLFANIRPVVLYNELTHASALRTDIAKKGIDLIIVRDLEGGMYLGARGYREGAQGQEAFDTEVYSINQVETIAKTAFEIAKSRRKKVVSVDKANVLDSAKLWRKTVSKIANRYPEVEIKNMHVEQCAAQLLANPSQFDVILTTQMFGDILSGAAAMLTGSQGMLPSASLGAGKFGVYEPSCPSFDTAGADSANPIGAILAVGMMLSTSFGLAAETRAIELAVRATLAKGYRTPDIMGADGKKKIGCAKMAEEICLRLLSR
ncbi:MAG: 3-isopropylmalate dehydrogenase [Firmicutes bacterium]|nr:3-isopropylmalate dehydrogenase [Bacillota bacterium]